MAVGVNMTIDEWAAEVNKVIEDVSSRLKKLENANNGKELAGFYSNIDSIKQLIRSWDAYVDLKTVGELPLQDYQRKDMTMFDFIEWLRKDVSDEEGSIA